MGNTAYDDQNPLTEENVGGGAAHRHRMVFAGATTWGYSRPLSSHDFGAQRFGGDTRDRLVQRETDGVNGDVLVCGGVFQECPLYFERLRLVNVGQRTQDAPEHERGRIHWHKRFTA